MKERPGFLNIFLFLFKLILRQKRILINWQKLNRLEFFVRLTSSPYGLKLGSFLNV